MGINCSLFIGWIDHCSLFLLFGLWFGLVWRLAFDLFDVCFVFGWTARETQRRAAAGSKGDRALSMQMGLFWRFAHRIAFPTYLFLCANSTQYSRCIFSYVGTIRTFRRLRQYSPLQPACSLPSSMLQQRRARQHLIHSATTRSVLSTNTNHNHRT